MIGPTFSKELAAAGLTGLPFSWSADGDFYFGNMTQQQKDAVLAVYAAHDHTKQLPPDVVTMRQARLALLQNGYLSTVNAAIDAGGDADKITWEYAAEVNRNSPLVTNMALALNLTEQDLDNLFTLAATL